MGYIPLKDGSTNARPLDSLGLLKLAEQLGLAGIEIPLSGRVPSFDGRVVDLPEPTLVLVAELGSRHMQLVADYGIIVDNTPQHFIDYLRTAKRMGATLVRAILSNVLCGDRRTCAGGWRARLEDTAARLREVLPVAEELGVSIAIENHQDATTDDLLQLFEMSGSGRAFGITLDTGNPLAVAEDPVETATCLAHLIRHVHLKDYTIHFAPEGYRLVRCAAGDGVIDFPAILEIVHEQGPNVSLSIEIAAQTARTIPLLEPEWWTSFPLRDAAALVGPLQVLWSKGRPADEPYASAWERGASAAEVIAEERAIVEKSVTYFRNLKNYHEL
jgi:sugar phosphate isomerase/epimerase